MVEAGVDKAGVARGGVRRGIGIIVEAGGAVGKCRGCGGFAGAEEVAVRADLALGGSRGRAGAEGVDIKGGGGVGEAMEGGEGGERVWSDRVGEEGVADEVEGCCGGGVSGV